MSLDAIFPVTSNYQYKRYSPSGNIVDKKVIYTIEERIRLINKLIDKYRLVDVYGCDNPEVHLLAEIGFWNTAMNDKKFNPLNEIPRAYEHYSELMAVIKQLPKIKFIDYSFYVPKRQTPIKVDIVAENGLLWIKLITSDYDEYADEQRGVSSSIGKILLDKAEELINAAAENTLAYLQPKILFYFVKSTENELRYLLNELGIWTATKENANDLEEVLSYFPNINLVSTDTTTLLALTSNLCNGGCNCKFDEPIIADQVERERRCPVKFTLDKMLGNKRLICCQSAMQGYLDALKKHGGPKERERSKKIIQRVELLPDVEDIPKYLKRFKFKSKKNKRTLKVIAFSLKNKAITITGNQSFMRIFHAMNFNVPVYLHQARCLTELLEVPKHKENVVEKCRVCNGSVEVFTHAIPSFVNISKAHVPKKRIMSRK